MNKSESEDVTGIETKDQRRTDVERTFQEINIKTSLRREAAWLFQLRQKCGSSMNEAYKM
jgi:hypothetical protein